nr:hypothetical protein [Tanacetum cinerariifolium]GEY10959.1 hypothetical protein [Tanacetum cinerariifolium]
MLKGMVKGKARERINQFISHKPKNPIPSTKEHPIKDDAFYHCKEVGNCKRNYLAYLAKLIKKKKQVDTANYALESVTRILNMVSIKKVDKTPYELWFVEFLKKNLISQKVSGRTVELKEIQDEDTSPSENTSKIPMEVEEETWDKINGLDRLTWKAHILDSYDDKLTYLIQEAQFLTLSQKKNKEQASKT